MKKIIALVLSAVLFVSLLCTAVFAAGDVNSDEKLNTVDVILILRHVAGWDLENFDMEGADMNGDGKVNTTDAILLLRELVKSDEFEYTVLGYGSQYYHFKWEPIDDKLGNMTQTLNVWLLGEGDVIGEGEETLYGPLDLVMTVNYSSDYVDNGDGTYSFVSEIKSLSNKLEGNEQTVEKFMQLGDYFEFPVTGELITDKEEIKAIVGENYLFRCTFTYKTNPFTVIEFAEEYDEMGAHIEDYYRVENGRVAFNNYFYDAEDYTCNEGYTYREDGTLEKLDRSIIEPYSTFNCILYYDGIDEILTKVEYYDENYELKYTEYYDAEGNVIETK